MKRKKTITKINREDIPPAFLIDLSKFNNLNHEEEKETAVNKFDKFKKIPNFFNSFSFSKNNNKEKIEKKEKTKEKKLGSFIKNKEKEKGKNKEKGKRKNKNEETWVFRFKSIFVKPKPIRKKINLGYIFGTENKFAKKELSSFSKIVNNYKEKIPIIEVKNRKKAKEKEKQKKLNEQRYIQKISWYRQVITFFLILILLIIPFKVLEYLNIINFSTLEDRVMVHSQAAIDNLLLASNNFSQLTLDQASYKFTAATNDFIAAQEEIESLNSWLLTLASFSSNPKIKLASFSKHFLRAGQHGSELGSNLSLALESLFNNQDENLIDTIDNFTYYSNLAINNINNLSDNLNKIDRQVLPEEYQVQFLTWQEIVINLRKNLLSLVNSAEEIKDFLGYSHNRRYLLIFQNNTEMRGSGGFLGSFALIDFANGEIRNIEVPAGGSYDTEAGMRSFIRSPRPLWLLAPRWYFWDANWWPDWPTTAENLRWFYEKSDGPTVDGVISFTPDVLAGLLEITGPINLEKDYDLFIDADNFWHLIQSTVEKQNLMISHPDFAQKFPDSPENQPKKIIGDLMTEILDILPTKINVETLPILINIFEKNRQAKNILLYFADPKLQKKVEKWGLDGSIVSSRHDYLMVTHTNIAGQKSDKKMEEKIFLDSQILNSGKIINELTIIREHQGIKNEPLTGARNVDWLRVYVPAGSRLLEASGFSQPDSKYFKLPESDWQILPFLAETEELAEIEEKSGLKIYEEFDKTVFANWVMTDPGKTSVIKIRYELPFLFKPVKRDRNYLDFLNHLLNTNQKIPAVHSLLVQKQPGLKPAQFFSRLRMPDNWYVDWHYPPEIKSDDAWLINSLIDRDKFWSILALPEK